MTIVFVGGTETFNDFFYRKLKPGARPVADPDDPTTLVSCADVSDLGGVSFDDRNEINEMASPVSDDGV
jgi:hypothetical protein